MRRNSARIGRWCLTVGTVVIVGVFAGCGRESGADAPRLGERGGQEHGEEEKNVRSFTIEEIAAAQCEHGMAAYQCDECRYELGVVKVPPDMMKQASTDTSGLFVSETVAARRMIAPLEFTGEIQLNENQAVHVSPRVAGIIEQVYVDIGERISRGAVLFRINSVELGNTLASYELNRSLAELSFKNYEREKLLKEQNISSDQDLIDAHMAYERHKAELESAAEALRVFGLTDNDLKALRTRNGGGASCSLPVRASIDGTILMKHAVVGELVEPGHDVLLLADLSSVWVWADIYEKDLPLLLAAGDRSPIPVGVHVKAFPEHTFDGTIDYIGATMDERTRTVKVRATVMNRDGLLRPGMFCEIRAGFESDETVLAVPKAALLSDEGDVFVFAFWKEDYYVRRAVRTGREFLDLAEVLDGLKPGDTIIAEGAFLLKSDVLREKMGAGCAD